MTSQASENIMIIGSPVADEILVMSINRGTPAHFYVRSGTVCLVLHENCLPATGIKSVMMSDGRMCWVRSAALGPLP